MISTVPSYDASMRSASLPSKSLASARRQSSLAIMLRKKSDMEIVLEGDNGVVHTYSTYDEIKGRVVLNFEKDTTIDDLTVTLEGQSATFVDRLTTLTPTTGRITGKHTFLRLQQPIEGEALPPNRFAKAGQTYSIPFTFVVPDRLLPNACSHAVDNEGVRHAHLYLPPSLGEPDVAGDALKLMDDLAPEMSKISYAIHAKVAKRNLTGRAIELANRSAKIRIVPAVNELPLIHVEEDDTNYILRREKGVKKGLFKVGKIGRITAETTQPRSLRLPHVQKRSLEPASTTTTINLRFDPTSPDEQPPQLGSITNKLRVNTFFGVAAFHCIADIPKQNSWSALHGHYPEVISLSSRCLSTVQWTRHDANDPHTDLRRQPSTVSTSSQSSIPEPSATYTQGSPFYTASVIVPISLPDTYTSSRSKSFVPTFHSCIVSRIYTLELQLSYQTPRANIGSPSIVLKVPIQISSEGGVPPAQFQETEANIAAEVARQFGLYQQQQLQGDGLESPRYEEMPAYSALPTTTHTSLQAGAPPEYHSESDGGIIRDVVGRPRTITALVAGV